MILQICNHAMSWHNFKKKKRNMKMLLKAVYKYFQFKETGTIKQQILCLWIYLQRSDHKMKL